MEEGKRMVHQGLRVCEECRRVRRRMGGLRVHTKGNPRVRKEGVGVWGGGVAVRHGDAAALGILPS